MSWEYVDSTLRFYSSCCITVFCFQKKKKEFLSTFNSKRIHVRRHFAQYSYANFQIFTAAYILTFNLKK